MRPEAQADVRPNVEQNLARLELCVHGLEVWDADDDRATATLRRARADDLEAGLVEEPDEMRRLAHRVLPDPLDADLLDDLVAGCRRVERGHVRRPGQETGGALRVLELRREVERSRVGLPADERRLEPLGEIGTDVEPRGAGTATEPFDAPADGEVDVQRGHIQRNGADGLVRVEDHVSADLVRALDDRLDVLDAAGLEDHMADRDEQRALVDRLDDRLLVRADDDLGAACPLPLLQVTD